MRLASFSVDGEDHFGCIASDRVVDLASEPARSQFGTASQAPSDLLEFLRRGDSALEKARALLADLDSGRLEPPLSKTLSEVRLRAPLTRPAQIIAVGRNYHGHATEVGDELPSVPRIFPKWPSTVVGPGDPIVKPRMTDQLDWEVELAVVIGKRASHVSEADALEHVVGYTLLNDVSARDIQFSKPEQLALSKNFRSFAPMGPWIVTTDEIPSPDNLQVRSWVNGELMQEASTATLIFSVSHLVSFLSHVLPLEIGDVISTGTPAGVGAFRDPPIFLKAGDRVRLQLDHYGELENIVVDEPEKGA